MDQFEIDVFDAIRKADGRTLRLRDLGAMLLASDRKIDRALQKLRRRGTIRYSPATGWSVAPAGPTDDCPRCGGRDTGVMNGTGDTRWTASCKGCDYRWEGDGAIEVERLPPESAERFAELAAKEGVLLERSELIFAVTECADCPARGHIWTGWPVCNIANGRELDKEPDLPEWCLLRKSSVRLELKI